MVLAEVVNDNSISAYAFSAFTAIILALIGGWFQLRGVKAKQADAADEARKAKDAALKASENTTNVSNGFASGVDTKLTRIYDLAVSTDAAVKRHLEWHVDHPSQERKQ